MKTHIIKLSNKNNKKLQEIKKENDLRNVDNTLNFILEKYELVRNNTTKHKKGALGLSKTPKNTT